MKFKLKHSHGTTETHETWDDTWAALLAVYGPETFCVGPDSRECGAGNPPSELAGNSALVWQCEADSEDDDGVRGVARIYSVDV